MGKKTLPDSAHQKKYAEAIKVARLQGLEAFHNWFDKSGSLYELTLRGFWDFSFHILTPAVQKFIANPERKTAMEIGYGGGRLLNAACHFFSKVIGINFPRPFVNFSANFNLKAFLFMLRYIQHIFKIGKSGTKQVLQEMAS